MSVNQVVTGFNFGEIAKEEETLRTILKYWWFMNGCTIKKKRICE